MRQWHGAIVMATALGASACHLAEPPGCDICTTSAVVYGRVLDASGAPVSGAVVHVEAYYADSGRGSADAVVGFTNVVPRTDAVGRYRDQPLALAAPFRAWLVVRVSPPASAGLSEAVASGAQVEFRQDYRSADRDSVRVDVVVSRSVQ